MLKEERAAKATKVIFTVLIAFGMGFFLRTCVPAGTPVKPDVRPCSTVSISAPSQGFVYWKDYYPATHCLPCVRADTPEEKAVCRGYLKPAKGEE